jgi:hypothetical protein
MALVADVSVPESPTGVVTLVDTHLENKCKPACRRKQMAALLETIQDVHNPLILAGDMNTTGKDGSPMSVRGELIRLVKDYEFWIKQSLNWFTPVSLPSYALMPFNFWRTYRDPTATHIPLFASLEGIYPDVCNAARLRRHRAAQARLVSGQASHERSPAKAQGISP